MSDLTIYSSIAVQGVVEELLPQFETEQGIKAVLTWGTAPMLIKRLQSGETADVLILNRAGFDTMNRAGRIAAGTEATLASSATAMAVKAGAPKPDISTPEALKKTLLASRAISYTHPDAGGASGIHFAKVIEKMGIAAEINAKTKFPPPAGLSGAFLPTGEVDLAVQQVPELRNVPGIDILGFLPGDLHMVTVFVAGVETASSNAPAAKAFIDFFQSPQAKALFRAKGLDPA